MLRKCHWAQAGDEPSIADLLSDPIAEALMEADGVDFRDVLAIFHVLGGARAAPAISPSPVLGGESPIALIEASDATEEGGL